MRFSISYPTYFEGLFSLYTLVLEQLLLWINSTRITTFPGQSAHLPAIPFVCAYASLALPVRLPRWVGASFSGVSAMWDFWSVVDDHRSPLISVSSHFAPVRVPQFASCLWWFISSGLTEGLGVPLKAWLFSSCCWASLFCLTLIYKTISPKLLK